MTGGGIGNPTGGGTDRPGERAIGNLASTLPHGSAGPTGATGATGSMP
jgi:hypothetical protein